MESSDVNHNSFQESVAAVSMPEYNDTVKSSIVDIILLGYKKYYGIPGDSEEEHRVKAIEFFNSLLKECNAILAGGFLLHSIHKDNTRVAIRDQITDMDLYVPCKYLSKFNKTIMKLGDTNEFTQHNATFYCLSFLRKNGIRSVQRVINPDYHTHHIADIMAVRNSRSPLDVVKSFDLTFCQIWYDGNTVMATHPEHVRNKTGLLQKDYALLLLKGNEFLKRRIQKYSHRGYTIKQEPIKLDLTDERFTGGSKCIEKPEHDETYFKRWCSRVLFNFCINGNYRFISSSNLRSMNAKEYARRKFFPTTELKKPIDEMIALDSTDGYDSDDYDITKPETYYPILDNYYKSEPEVYPQLPYEGIEDERKFWYITNNLLKIFFSSDERIYPYDLYIIRDEDIRIDKIYNILYSPFSKINPYYNGLYKYSVRSGVDAITLSEEPVYDIHEHILDDAIGRDGIKIHLNQYKNYNDKDNVPCYVNGCTKNLTLNEIRMMVDKNYYNMFIHGEPPPLPPPDNLLRNQGPWDINDEGNEKRLDVIEILRNYKSTTDSWGNIYHTVMCPFCLVFIGRNQGCAYVKHEEGHSTNIIAPYCKPQNIITEIVDKYKNVFGNGFEVCIECGRPCHSHKHISLDNPPRYVSGRAFNYSKCNGGGRREGIARVIAVHNTIKENPDMDPIELRRIAGLAAEAAAKDENLLVKADAILAKETNTRVKENLNLGAPAEGGKRRIGKIDSYGYKSYKDIIKKTRKSFAKKTKKTRKN